MEEISFLVKGENAKSEMSDQESEPQAQALGVNKFKKSKQQKF